MSRSNGNPAALEYAKRQKRVHRLLDLAMKEAQGSTLMVTEWLDERDELEDYGYTKELDEKIQSLEESAAAVAEMYPPPKAGGLAWDWERFLELRTMEEQIQIDQFFQGLVEARRFPKPHKVAQPVAADLEKKVADLVGLVHTLTCAVEGSFMDYDTEEKALFLVNHWEDLSLEGLRHVVRANSATKSHEWDTLQEKKSAALADALESLIEVEAMRVAGKDFPARMLLPQACKLAADALGAVGRIPQVLELETFVGGLEEPRAFLDLARGLRLPGYLEKLQFLKAHQEIPLEALEWISRVVKGEEPPATPDHMEALDLLREAGRLVGGLFSCTSLQGQALRMLRDELQRDHLELQSRVQAHLDRFDVPA